MIAITAAFCVAVLAASVYPGWLDSLLFLTVIVGLLGLPIAAVLVVLGCFIFWRNGGEVVLSDRFPWKKAAVVLAVVSIPFVGLVFSIPKRIAFEFCRGSLQQLVDGPVAEARAFQGRIGPYYVDECRIDDRGGEYFRVQSGGHGLGPDVMSYGFCYHPNDEGSPFGACDYETSALGGGWYSFRACDDYY